MSSVAPDTQTLTVAFAGNPNVGKTALINAVSQSRLKVGNWPGVTVEKKEARYTQGNTTFHLIDLPGTYSLVPHSIEERVSRDYLQATPPDLLINVVDASNLEKSLSFTLELATQGIPMVLVLNMWDEFLERQDSLNVSRLSEILGMPVLTTSAVTGHGLEELKTLLSQQSQTPISATTLDIPEEASQRYALIQRWAHEVTTRPDILKPSRTERFDQFLLNEWSGIPIFMGVLFLVFKLTFAFEAGLAQHDGPKNSNGNTQNIHGQNDQRLIALKEYRGKECVNGQFSSTGHKRHYCHRDLAIGLAI